MLIENKAGLLAALSTYQQHNEPLKLVPRTSLVPGNSEINDPLRGKLVRLATDAGCDPEPVRRLPADDVVACEGQSAETLRGYIAMLAITDLRKRGNVPADETAIALCRHCGPVWVHPDVASVAPVVNGWPRLLGCPWCFIRAVGGYVPRPLVTCGDCTNFVRDTINPGGSMGSCHARCDSLQQLPVSAHQAVVRGLATEFCEHHAGARMTQSLTRHPARRAVVV